MPEFDPSVPSIARVYDLFLGGKDNFASDRALADRMIEMAPLVPVITRENRQFLVRAVTWAASEGIGQFVDLGCGMPTSPDTLERPRGVIPDSRVAYVDNDPVVSQPPERQGVAKGTPGVTVVAGDVREVPVILDGVRAGIDLNGSGLPHHGVLAALLHRRRGTRPGRQLHRCAAAGKPPGSCPRSMSRTQGADEGFAGYSSAVAPVYNHSAAEFASFFDPFEILPPGVVDARRWGAQAGAPTFSSVTSTPSPAPPVHSSW